jgi:hypothetical protein
MNEFSSFNLSKSQTFMERFLFFQNPFNIIFCPSQFFLHLCEMNLKNRVRKCKYIRRDSTEKSKTTKRKILWDCFKRNEGISCRFTCMHIHLLFAFDDGNKILISVRIFRVFSCSRRTKSLIAFFSPFRVSLALKK